MALRLSISAAPLALTLLASAAVAEPTSDAIKRADALFEEAKALLRDGQWPAACERFERSFSLDPSPSTQVKVARCREHEGRLLAAAEAYHRARELNQKLSRDPARVEALEAVIREDLAALDAVIPRLVVSVQAPPGTVVTLSVDGRGAKPGAHALLLDPGEHEILAQASGFADARTRVTLVRGATKEVTLELTPRSAAQAASPVPPAVAPPGRAPARPPDDRRAEGSGQRLAGGLTFGAGVVTLGVAGYFGLRTLALVREARPDCSTVTNDCGPTGLSRLERARDAQRTGFILLGGGAALAATGVVLYLTAPTQSVSLRAAVTDDAVGGTLEGSF